MKIEDQTWRQVVHPTDVKTSEHKKQIEKVKNDRRNLQASIHALNTQIQFWQLQTKAKSKTLSDTYNMSAAIGKNMKKTYYDKLTQELELEILDKKIKTLQDELERMAGKSDTFWEVAIVLSGPQTTEEVVTYTYSITGCGWLPLYRLEARPGDSKVLFTWEAEMWRGTGQDWNQIMIYLATLKPPTSLSPFDMLPWVIKEQPLSSNKKTKTTAKGRIKKNTDESPEEITKLSITPEPTAAPQQISQSTYAVWKIGAKTIPAGLRQKVKLQEEIWPSDFSYVIRPSVSPQAYLKASIHLPEPREIPLGNATFMVDGAILGKQPFSSIGREAVLYFGLDSMVTAERILLSKKSGEKDVLAGRQTYLWEWRIDVKNSREDAVKVLVEEPNPQRRDERMILTLKHDPEPSEKTLSLLNWNLDIAAGQKKSILSSVRLEAPADMKLDLGWQQ